MRRVWTVSRQWGANRRHRGSTLILVLAVLSILILIAATLSYTARLEEISSRNFADGVQSRMAAQTGVGQFFALADGRTTSVTLFWTGSMGLPSAGNVATGLSSARSSSLRVGQSATGRPFLVAPAAAGNRLEPKRTSAASLESEIARASAQSDLGTDLVQIRVVDESAKINVNALGSWEELGLGNASRVQPQSPIAISSNNQTTSSPATTAHPLALADALYAVLSSREVSYPGASREMARQIARSILRYRYGPDGQPGAAGVDDDNDGPGRERSEAGGGMWDNTRLAGLSRGIPQSAIEAGGLGGNWNGSVDEPDEFVADPRLPPNGDDRPFRQVEDLLKVDGMTPELFQVLRPYVTVFSASERRIGPERNAPAQVDLNAATLDEIYGRLRLAYPGVPDATVAQFAANIVDYRDADSAPTLIPIPGSADPILGTELTPCITEVWPNAPTNERDNDSGKFVEIYNPYDVNISLAGWSLRILGQAAAGSGSQADSLPRAAGQRVDLRGTLVPGGFLIVTDDYNGRNNPRSADEYPGYGSFYRVFGVVPNTRNHLMIELPTLQIPGSEGRIELRDAAGNLIDYFRYGGGAAGVVRRSFQRLDPRIRTMHVARCSPYALAPTSGREIVSASVSPASASAIKNAPFQNALELFSIAVAYSSAGQSQQAVAWQTPAIGSGQADTFDARLADLFTVWTDRDPRLVASQVAAAETATTSSLLWTPSEATGPSPLCEWGKINVNSAPVPVLRALPGLSDRQIQYLLWRRQGASGADITGKPMAYARLSEWLADGAFWEEASSSARLVQLARWIGSIAFTSRAYLIDSENLTEPPSGPRLASRSKVEALVSTDGGRNQVVFWRYLE